MITKTDKNVNKTNKNVIKNDTYFGKIIQKCKNRHDNPILTPIKTIRPGNEYRVSYAKDRTCNPADFNTAGIGIIPCGYYDVKGKFHANSPERYGQDSGKNWYTCYAVKDWKPQTWLKSHGIQVYTGGPSNYLTDLDFEYAIIRDHPEITVEILSRLCDLTPNPFIVISKSGGFRFSCHTPEYIHPKANQHREYITTWVNRKVRKDLYLEIFGEKGLSRYDARYEIVEGSIFEIPTIDHTSLFEVIDDLRDQIGEPRPEAAAKKQKNTRNHTKASQPPKNTQTINVENHEIDVTNLTFTNNRSRVYPTAVCPVTEHKDKHALAVQFYNHDNGSVNGYCHNCSSHWWVIPPSRELTIKQIREDKLSPLAIYRKPIKLRKDRITPEEHITLAETANRIWQILSEQDARIIGLRADTGTGKNYQTEQYALSEDEDKGAILINVPHHDLAIDLERRMQAILNKNFLSESHVYRRRGLLYKWNDGKDAAQRFPFEVPCLQAPRCDAYRRKGGNMYKVICATCPVQSECLEYGYRSQPIHSKNALMIITAHAEMHTNPAYKGFAKPYLKDSAGKQRLVVQDDISIANLFNIYEISKAQLDKWIDTWQNEPLAEFARKIHRICTEGEPTPYMIGEYLKTLDDEVKAKINYQMTHVRIQTYNAEGIPNPPEEMTLDNAVSRGYFDASTETKIAKLPRVYPKNWTLLDQLIIFFNHYKRTEDAPIQYHNDTLKFALPPSLHDDIWKAVFMSATLDEELFTRTFPKAHTNNLPPTEWKPPSVTYQLRTNRNPRATVYKFIDSKPASLSTSAEKTWQLMINEIRNTPNTKHAIITYKQILEWKQKEEASDFDTHDNIIATAHYGGLVGLDTEFQNADVLWILFAPEIPSHTIIWNAKLFYGNDETPLDYERDDKDVYKDKRLRRIWKYAVISELIQAIGRARLVRSAKTIMIFTSHYIPTITDRPETQLFDEADFEIAGSIANLGNAIKKREAAKKKAQDLTGENTLAEIQKVYGCTERQARKHQEKLTDISSNVKDKSHISESLLINNYCDPFRNVTLASQIITVLESMHHKTAEIIEVVEGQPTAIKNELKRLVDTGKIVKVRYGVYGLP
ncbi:hypothetical protein F4212_15500, partial [Candidatus Poribacteria bacterium]|nr:hypothetical protein [Candidatus Poribacteria bacterium]